VPTTLGAPAARRVFVGASAFFLPPLSIADTIQFPGLANAPGQDLILLRCVPPSSSVEAITVGVALFEDPASCRRAEKALRRLPGVQRAGILGEG
jgi:hypothetical protein